MLPECEMHNLDFLYVAGEGRCAAAGSVCGGGISDVTILRLLSMSTLEVLMHLSTMRLKH